ncbi:MAG: hypothetical protein V1911_01895, partial [Candidatus Micrarchaeota archaeon]
MKKQLKAKDKQIKVVDLTKYLIELPNPVKTVPLTLIVSAVFGIVAQCILFGAVTSQTLIGGLLMGLLL